MADELEVAGSPPSSPTDKASDSLDEFSTEMIFEGIKQKAEQEGFYSFMSAGPLSVCLNYAMHPHRPERQAWDALMLILVFYSSVIEPYTAAFASETKPQFWTIVIDLCFYVDIVANFWTGFDKGYEVILDKGMIVRNYLSGWFTVDLIAVS